MSEPQLVVIESPYAGDTGLHKRYARACLADSLLRGEAPFASHLLYTQPGVLDDTIPAERAQGINAGFAWGHHADLVTVYTDLGITEGMQAGIDRATTQGQRVEERSIGFAWATLPRSSSKHVHTYDIINASQEQLSSAVERIRDILMQRWTSTVPGHVHIHVDLFEQHPQKLSILTCVSELRFEAGDHLARRWNQPAIIEALDDPAVTVNNGMAL